MARTGCHTPDAVTGPSLSARRPAQGCHPDLDPGPFPYAAPCAGHSSAALFTGSLGPTAFALRSPGSGRWPGPALVSVSRGPPAPGSGPAPSRMKFRNDTTSSAVCTVRPAARSEAAVAASRTCSSVPSRMMSDSAASTASRMRRDRSELDCRSSLDFTGSASGRKSHK